MKLGKPTHFKIGYGSSACGIIRPDYWSLSIKDVDCELCKKTKVMQNALHLESKSNDNHEAEEPRRKL